MTTPPPVHLPGTEVHSLHSSSVDYDFEISIQLPPPEVEGPVPVIYVTDANMGFGMATAIASMLAGGAEIPPCLLVGIGYPVGADFLAFARLRTRDFTPSVDERQLAAIEAFSGARPESGGAGAFLDFLTAELRDWVNSQYDVVGADATYIGDSMGGLFGMFALFHKPAAFKRYLIGSPWLCWDYPISFKYEEAYAAEHPDLPATVFLAAGADEAVLAPGMPEALAPIFQDAEVAAYTQRLADSLESRKYPNLRLTTRIFPEETHYTLPAILMAHGLRRVFQAE